MPEEIERLSVAIEANIAPLLKGVREGVDAVEKELQGIGKTGKRAFDETGNAAKRSKKHIDDVEKKSKGLTSVFGKLKKTILGFGAAFVGVAGLRKVTDFIKESIGLSKVQIKAETQLETVLKSTGYAAGLTAQELKDLAAQMQSVTNFGDETVIAGENLLLTFTKIGKDVFPRAVKSMLDVSTAMKQDVKTSAIQVGKALNDPIAGLANLSRTGIQFTDQQKDLIKSLVETGDIAGAQVVILEELETQFGGSAEAARKADGGIIALKNTFGDLQEILGGQILKSIREDTSKLSESLADPEMQESLAEMARAFGEAAVQAKELIASGLFDKLTPEFVDSLAQTAENLAQVSLALQQIELPDFSLDLGVEPGSLTDKILRFGPAGIIGEAFESAPDLTEAIMQLDTIIKAEDARFKAQLRGQDGQAAYNAVILEGNKKLEEYLRASQELTEVIEDGQTATERAREAEAARLQGLAGLYATQEDGAEIEEAVNEQLEKSLELLEGMTSEFIDLTEERNEKIEELEKDHTQNIINIETDYIHERLELGHKLAEDLADLEEETADKRADIIADTRRDLAKLEADTDRSLKEERDEFQRDELRETEDHLRSMRDLRNRFLMDIEDAVKNRDARALVDAQRRYREESQQKEQEFGIDQRRDREDQDLRLQQIRENEQRRSQEILEKQADALQQLEEHERKKRQKIQDSFQEEMTELDAEYAEKTLKENQNFMERQTQLEEMLQKRLETVAKELADEKELNEDGAKAVLETLNETFGVGGDIDKLMEDFTKRRNQQLVIKMSVERNLTDFGPDSQGGTARTWSGGTSATPQRIPAFQHGGTLLATKPTLAQFGEVPEMVTFTPLSQMNNTAGQPRQMEIDLKMSGSAPPGVRSADRDAIAGVLANALREAGAMVKQSGR